MKLIYAKYPGKCQHCGGKTERNEEVWWEPGTGVMHQPCKAEWEHEGGELAGQSSQHERLMQDPEYAKGVQDAKDYQFNRDTFGSDYAEAIQMEKEFNEDSY